MLLFFNVLQNVTLLQCFISLFKQLSRSPALTFGAYLIVSGTHLGQIMGGKVVLKKNIFN